MRLEQELITAIVNPADEELALTLNGKKKKIQKWLFCPGIQRRGFGQKATRKHYLQDDELQRGAEALCLF